MGNDFSTTVMLNDGRDMVLRALGPQDKELALSFINDLGGIDQADPAHDLASPESLGAVMDRLAEPEVFCLAAFDPGENDRLAGYALLEQGRHSAAHRASLQSFVHPEYRDLGLGSNLMRTLTERAQEMSLMILQVEIRVDQQDLINACKRLGYQLKAVLEDYRVDPGGAPYDVIIMLKRLRKPGESEFLYRY